LSRRSSTQTAVEEGRHSTMSSHPLSGDYLLWLASQIRGEDDGHPRRTYDGLLALMFEKEFIWLVPNDDNRLMDGLGLRVEFCQQHDLPVGQVAAFLSKGRPIPPCSFLEVLIALSRRLAFNAGGSADGWAWVLMHNLELHRITDPVGRGKARRADAIMEQCIWRKYGPDGRGGFFPLEIPREDQSQVEIWYQMADYISEGTRER
jgi:hypothetical protein